MNKNAKEKQLLEEAYSQVLREDWKKGTSKAPKGDSFDMSRGGAPSRVDAASDGPGGRYRRTRPPGYSTKTHGEMEEEGNEKDLSKMYKFGNIQFMHLGKDRNGADAFRVFKDGSYVLYATMFGPRKTVTLYADPEADGQQTAGPEEGKALKEFDKTQVPGGIKQVAAKLGASEDAEEVPEEDELEALIAAEDAEDIDKDEDKLVKVDDETEDAKYFGKNTPL